MRRSNKAELLAVMKKQQKVKFTVEEIRESSNVLENQKLSRASSANVM